jgi:hypothetical protein
VLKRAGQPIELDDDQRLAAADAAEQGGQHGAAAVGAGGGFLEDLGAAGLAQLIHLALHRLPAGADAGIPDQAGRLTIRHRAVCRPMTGLGCVAFP